MRTVLIVIGIVLMAGGILTLIARRGREAPSPAVQPQPAPEFALADYQGREVKLSDFRGRPVIVNSWAAWCPFCREELVDFAAAQKEFGDQVVIIAIDRAESLETAKKYSDELGVSDELIFLLDPDDSFYQAIGGFSMPETIFVDAQGLTRDHKRGPMPLEEMRRRTQRAFNL